VLTSPRRCGGTPERAAYTFAYEEWDPSKLEYTERKKYVAAEPARIGCGHALDIVDVLATPARLGERPLIRVTAPALICPKCDAPEPPDHEQARLRDPKR